MKINTTKTVATALGLTPQPADLYARNAAAQTYVTMYYHAGTLVRRLVAVSDSKRVVLVTNMAAVSDKES